MCNAIESARPPTASEEIAAPQFLLFPHVHRPLHTTQCCLRAPWVTLGSVLSPELAGGTGCLLYHLVTMRDRTLLMRHA